MENALTKLLPPDENQKALSRKVNGKLGPNQRVTFFRATVDGVTQFGAVFEYGLARKADLKASPYYDVDQVVADVERWVKRL